MLPRLKHREAQCVHIKNNDLVLCTTFRSEAQGQNGASCSVIAQLAIANSIRVTGNGSETGRIQGGYSGFAGHIISDEITA